MQSVDDRLNSYAAYIDYQVHEAQRAIPFLSRFFCVQGARVLDIGTGRGGKSIAFALQGMNMIALDLDQAALELGAQTAAGRHAQINFLAGDGTCLPFPDSFFDAVLLDSMIEHVHDPLALLQECKRVLKRGGIVFVVFPPFYGPLSGHIDDFVMIPWFHLLPCAIIKRFLMARSQSIGILTPREAYEVYTTLNGLTIFKFRRFVQRVGFGIDYWQVRPFLTHPGTRFAVGLVSALRHGPRRAKLQAVLKQARHEFTFRTATLFVLLSLLSPLVFVPFLQEIAAGACKCVLRKE